MANCSEMPSGPLRAYGDFLQRVPQIGLQTLPVGAGDGLEFHGKAPRHEEDAGVRPSKNHF